MRCVALLVLCVLGVVCVHAQRLTYRMECERGPSLLFNAAASPDGRAVLVGDIGRYGIIGPRDTSFAWYCMPEQVAIRDAWFGIDTLIFVGDDGGVWWQGGDSVWHRAPLPTRARCMTVARRGESTLVGTQDGTVWSCKDLSTGQWERILLAPAPVLDIYADSTTMLVVGARKTFLEWNDATATWIDRSVPGAVAPHCMVRPIGRYVIIGTDSGRIVRYDRMTTQQTTVQVFPPHPYGTVDDTSGYRADRTLTSCIGPNGELIISGAYYEYSTQTDGIYVSTDDGQTFRRRDPNPDRIRTEYVTTFCPLVYRTDNVIHCVYGDPSNPIVVFRTSDLGQSWTTALSTTLWQQVAAPDSVQHFFKESNTSVISSPVDGGVLVSTIRVPISYRDIDLIPSTTSIELWKFGQGNSRRRKLAEIQGQFKGLQRWGEMLLMFRDSSRIAQSVDNGRTWRIRQATGLPAIIALVTSSSAVVVSGSETVSVSFDTCATWTTHSFRPTTSEACSVGAPFAIDDSTMVVQVNYFTAQLFSRTVLFTMNIGKGEVLVDTLAAVPGLAFSAPTSFASADTVCMLMPVKIPPTSRYGTILRCRYNTITAAWECDTSVVLDANAAPRPINRTETANVVDDGEHLLWTLGSSIIVSTDRGWTWKEVPQATTGYNGSIADAASLGSEICIVGNVYFIATIDLNSPTSVDDADSVASHTPLDLSTDDLTSVSIVSMEGIAIAQRDNATRSELSALLQSLPSACYIVIAHTPTTTSINPILMVNGVMYWGGTRGQQ